MRRRCRFSAFTLYEARAGVRVALAWGSVTSDAAQGVLQSMESLGGRVFGLVRRQLFRLPFPEDSPLPEGETIRIIGARIAERHERRTYENG